MRKKLNLFMTIMVAMLLLTSCQTSNSTNEVEDDQDVIRVGVLIYRFDDQFIQYVMDEIDKERAVLEEMSHKPIVVDFVDGNNQADFQFDQIEDLISLEYDVLAINLVDRSEAAGVIDLAKAADIPIVFFNREPVQVDMARWNKIYYVGSKGEDAGRIQGEIVADTWVSDPGLDRNGDGIIQYIMIQGQEGHQDAILRTETSVKAILDRGLEVEELARDTANWQRQESKEKFINYLDVFSEELEFIISNNDMMALGAIDAMKELGYEPEDYIPIVGVDAIDDAVEAFNKGEMTGTVINDQSEQGKMVMRIAYYLALNEDPRDYINGIESGKYYRVEYLKLTK